MTSIPELEAQVKELQIFLQAERIKVKELRIDLDELREQLQVKKSKP